jgi:hypothetical protein
MKREVCYADYVGRLMEAALFCDIVTERTAPFGYTEDKERS